MGRYLLIEPLLGITVQQTDDIPFDGLGGLSVSALEQCIQAKCFLAYQQRGAEARTAIFDELRPLARGRQGKMSSGRCEEGNTANWERGAWSSQNSKRCKCEKIALMFATMYLPHQDVQYNVGDVIVRPK